MNFAKKLKLSLHNFTIEKILLFFTAFVLLLLPWQTQIIFHSHFPPEKTLGLTSGIFLTQFLILFLFPFILFNYHQKLITLLQKIKIPLILFFTLLIIQNYLYPNLQTLTHSFHLFTASIFFLILAIQSHHRDFLIKSFLAGLILPIFLAFYQIINNYSPASTILGLASRSAENLGDSVISLNENRQLRAYGSFSHPNIFAGYLALALIFLSHQKSSKLKKILTPFFLLTLLITFSKSAIFALFLIFTYQIFHAIVLPSPVIPHSRRLPLLSRKEESFLRRQESSIRISHPRSLTPPRHPERSEGSPHLSQKNTFQFKQIFLFIIFSIFPLIFLIPRFSKNSLEINSLTERLSQLSIIPEILNNFSISQFIFGSGLNSFRFLWHSINPELSWWIYQPIHNLPILIFIETGFIGFLILIFSFFAFKTKKIFSLKNINSMPIYLLIFISFFDHYLYSFWSGLALIALTISFIDFSKQSS